MLNGPYTEYLLPAHQWQQHPEQEHPDNFFKRVCHLYHLFGEGNIERKYSYHKQSGSKAQQYFTSASLGLYRSQLQHI